MADCSQFVWGSRQRQICDGDSELSLRRVNAFRVMFGVDPLPEVEKVATEMVVSGQVVSRIAPKFRPTQSAGGCCGGGKTKPVRTKRMKDGTGVGGRLIEMFKAAGFVACPDCYALAHKMNEWGSDGCREHIDEIVADILPRAIAWEVEQVGWWAKFMPQAVNELAIRAMVISAIETALPLEFEDTPPPVFSTVLLPKPSTKGKHWRSGKPPTKPSGPPIDTVDLSNATRHLTFHVYPVAGYGVWQWNCDQLLKHADLFNGRRIIAVATDKKTDSADDVRKYLADFTDEVIEVQNNSKLREVVSWVPMLSKLEPLNSPNDVTFSCHAKCVRHRMIPDTGDTGSTIFNWTQAMWDTCGNWDAVRPLLETHATVGSFRRRGSHPNTANAFGDWHYSGTFYWWRNRDAFRRDWKRFPQTFFGTEAWPGILFKKDEAAVVVGDDVNDLYVLKYWQEEIQPMVDEWRQRNG